MKTLILGLGDFLQILPFGDWLTTSPYGIVYGTLLFNVFSCLILFLHKLTFKVYFHSRIRKGVFLSVVGGTSFVVVGCYINTALKMLPSEMHCTFITPDSSYLLPDYQGLTLIAYLFFICYLLDFIIRLVRHLRKRKTDRSAATPTN